MGAAYLHVKSPRAAYPSPSCTHIYYLDKLSPVQLEGKWRGRALHWQRTVTASRHGLRLAAAAADRLPGTPFQNKKHDHTGGYQYLYYICYELIIVSASDGV